MQVAPVALSHKAGSAPKLTQPSPSIVTIFRSDTRQTHTRLIRPRRRRPPFTQTDTPPSASFLKKFRQLVPPQNSPGRPLQSGPSHETTSTPARRSRQAIPRLASLLLTLATTLTAHAQPAATPDLTSPQRWLPAAAPFSFQYAGAPSASLLPQWQFASTTSPTPDGRLTRYTYTDPVQKLRITADVRTFTDAPGLVDWVLHLRNGGTTDTPVIDGLLPLHTSLPLTAATATVRHARGSLGRAQDFEPREEHIGHGGSDHLASSAGDSSSGDTLPFFNLQTGDHGLIAAIGWTGNWKADLAATPDGQTLTLAAGMPHTHFILHPGEEVRTPRIVLMPWKTTALGDTWQDAQNLWRHILLTHYTPQENRQAMRGPVLAGSWGSEPIAQKMAYIDWIHGHSIPISLYTVDAGWYGASVGAEHSSTNPWWQNRGDWYPSPLYYPQGLKPLGDLLRSDNLGFSLWLEPETSVVGRQIFRDHPTWFLRTDHPQFTAGNPGPDVALANLGDPVALAGITRLVSDLITTSGMTWYRQDFNIPPERFWQLADTPDRIGITEMKHIAGLYQLWDTLLAQHPGLHIDNCASGGRRLDLEMMSRSFVVWRTDYGFADTLAEQAQTEALAPWVPENAGFETFTLQQPWTHPGPFDTPANLYLMRLAYDAGYSVGPGAAGVNNEPWVEWIKQAIAEFREVQPFLYADFYPLLSYSLSPDTWTAWQWNRPDHGDGLVIVLRRPGSPFTSMQLDLHHLDPQSRYTVEVRSGHEHAPTRTMTGSALSAMIVSLDQAPGSALIFYRKL